MANQNFKAVPKTAMDNPKLGITGKPWVDGDYKTTPKLQLRYVNGNIWITCYSNNPKESSDAGPINVKMDPRIANTFLAIIEDAIENPDGFTMRGVENKNYLYGAGGKRSDKPMVLSSAYVGVNGDGEICIIIKAYKRETVTFAFTTNFWFSLVDKGGQPLDKAKVSKYVAKGWLETARQIMGPIIAGNYVHPEPKQNNNYGNANTNASNPGGAGQGGSDPFEDDIAF